MAQKTPTPDPKDMIDAEATVTIARPVADVFAFWRALENFPRFMGNVKEVRALADNRHLWRVSGPVGTEVSWESDVTEMVANQRIAWTSRPGSTIANRGAVHFKPTATGGTEVHVKLGYAPPAGVVGHAVATLLGQNPGQQMNEDLQRCKALLEQGAVAKPGQGAVTEGQVRQPVSSAGRVS